MKDVILDRGTKMLDLHFKINQKKEALSKQQATNDEQTSYIPGSLRVGNPIAVPNYLKGSIILQEIEERGNIENETRKESFAGIAIDMTRAVVEETREMLKTEFFKTVGIISELLVVNFEEHAVDIIEYGRVNSSESLAPYAAYIFIQDHLGDSEMGVLLGLTEPDKAMKMYRKLHGSEKPDTYERNACMVARYLAETVASSLGNVMKQLTVVFFDFHRQKDRARKSAARSKAIREKHKLKEKNEEMQARIAKEEEEDREAAERGELPKRMIDQIKKEAKAEAKKLFEGYKKKERVKDSGGHKNQEPAPTNNGHDSKRKSGQSKKKSKTSSKKSSGQPRSKSRSKKDAKKGEEKSKSTSSKNTSKSNSRNGQNAGRGGRGGRGGRRSGRGRGRGQRN